MPSKKLIKAKRLHLKEQNRQFGSTLIELFPRELSEKSQDKPTRIWQSRDFAVHLWIDKGFKRLTVCRTANSDGKWKDGITWDELQRLKSEAGFGDCWAVEVYPTDPHVVNVANMRHLWLLESAPPYAWINGQIKSPETEINLLSRIPGINADYITLEEDIFQAECRKAQAMERVRLYDDSPDESKRKSALYAAASAEAGVLSAKARYWEARARDLAKDLTEDEN